RFSQLGLLTATIGQPNTKRRHVVVARISVRVLIRVLHIKVWTEILVRQFDLGVLLLNGGLLRVHVRILFASSLEEFRRSVRQRSHGEGIGNDVRRLLRTAQKLLNLGFKQTFFLMVLGDLLQNLRVLQ